MGNHHKGWRVYCPGAIVEKGPGFDLYKSSVKTKRKRIALVPLGFQCGFPFSSTLFLQYFSCACTLPTKK